MSLNLFGRAERRVAPAASSGGAPAFALSLPALGKDASGFAHYEWLLGPDRRIAGFRWKWLRRSGVNHHAVAELRELLGALRDAWAHPQDRWSIGNLTFMLEVTPSAIAACDWRGLPPRQTVLCWQAEDLAHPETLPLLQTLRQQGFGHLACGKPPEAADVRELLTHVDAGGGDAPLLDDSKGRAGGLQPVATRMTDWAQFDAWASRGIPVLVAPTLRLPDSPDEKVALGPEVLLIMELMQKVQRNEDVRGIEAALKHDAAITYRLLRHINSPAVGAGVQIESLRHAVNMLGYARLFRWLTVLLANLDGASRPAFLTKKAIVRGRFVELLGQALLGRHESDNLFLVGMFSAMEELLGAPSSELLEKVQLSDAVQRAVLKKEGRYGPFLALALACEAGAPETESLADALLMSASGVNSAHLAAIAWAQEASEPAS